MKLGNIYDLFTGKTIAMKYSEIVKLDCVRQQPIKNLYVFEVYTPGPGVGCRVDSAKTAGSTPIHTPLVHIGTNPADLNGTSQTLCFYLT